MSWEKDGVIERFDSKWAYAEVYPTLNGWGSYGEVFGDKRFPEKDFKTKTRARVYIVRELGRRFEKMCKDLEKVRKSLER